MFDLGSVHTGDSEGGDSGANTISTSFSVVLAKNDDLKTNETYFVSAGQKQTGSILLITFRLIFRGCFR